MTLTHQRPEAPDPGVTIADRYEETILERLGRDGYVVIPEVLLPGEVERLRAAAAEVARGAPLEAPPGSPAPIPGFVHRPGAATAHPEFTRLAGDPRLVRIVSRATTPDVHVYHSALDVHPPEPADPRAWRWHEDGGRMGSVVEARTVPSLKVACWLSDAEAPGHGNMEVVPGSHRWTRPLPRTPGSPPAGATPVLARAGDAVLFDRRIWHRRGTNTSRRTRIVVSFAYAPGAERA